MLPGDVQACALRLDAMNSSVIRRAAAMGGAVLVVAMSTAGLTAYSYLKPTASPSASIGSIALAASRASAGTVYELQASQARFVVDEVLRGTPYTVVGRTAQVAGQLVLDTSDTSTAQLGTVLVDARDPGNGRRSAQSGARQ